MWSRRCSPTRTRRRTSSAAPSCWRRHRAEIQGWLSPRGTSKPTTPKLLADYGYRWYGDVFDADLPYVQTYGDKKIVAIPLSYDVNDMPSMKYGHPPKMMLDSFNEVIDIARSRDDELRIIDVTNHAPYLRPPSRRLLLREDYREGDGRVRHLGRNPRRDRRSRACRATRTERRLSRPLGQRRLASRRGRALRPW
jgi:hypothetical protein